MFTYHEIVCIYILVYTHRDISFQSVKTSVLFRYYENRTGERFSALDGRLNSIEMEIVSISSSINATVSHVQSMYKYINTESSSCQTRLGRHTDELQVAKNTTTIF